jgi:hypothetical protein
MSEPEPEPDPYRPPKAEGDTIDDLAMRVGNPVHTRIFGVLFIVVVLGLPLVVGGFFGLLLAPIVGGILWGLYRVTLPSGPKSPSLIESAGTTSCPQCGSVQTDAIRYRNAGDPGWQCFACEHRW